MNGDRWTSHDGRTTIYHADAREFLPTLADASVDAFVTDPPFGIAKGAAFVRGDTSTIGDGDEPMNNCDGDPFFYVPEVARAVTLGGHLAAFYGRNRDEAFFEALRANGLTRWIDFYLVNNSPPPTPRPTFASAVQVCACATKPGATRRWFGGGATSNAWIGAPVTRLPTATGHTAEKPVACMEQLIRALSPVGGMVCDPFLGSGTTAVACVALGQRFVGCEREREWFEKACARVERHCAQGRLF